MRKKFKKEGWLHFDGAKTKNLIQNCVEKRNEWLSIIQNIVYQHTGVKIESYESKYLVEFALVKSIFRSLMRYDLSTYQLAKGVSKEVLENLGENGDRYYCTPPYTYVHFPNDASEASEFHVDVKGYEGEYIIAWVPLNSCYHQPMSLKPRSQHKWTVTRVIGAAERRLGVKNIPWFFKRLIAPDLECGEYLVWDGRLHHAGNLNKSNSTHVVLNFRMSTIPETLEPTITYNELQALGTGPIQQLSNDSVKAYANTYISIFQQIDNNLTWQKKQQSLIETSKEISNLISSWNLSTIDLKRVSFGLTLGAMRRPSKNPEVAYINLVANLIAPECLYLFHSFIKFAMENYTPEDVAKFLIYYLDLYPITQVAEVIKNIISQYPQLKSLDINLDKQNIRYDSWLK
jgi:hypothetical protein